MGMDERQRERLGEIIGRKIDYLPIVGSNDAGKCIAVGRKLSDWSRSSNSSTKMKIFNKKGE